MTAAILVWVLAIGAGTAFASDNRAASTEADGIALSEQLRIIEGISYVPIRAFAEQMGWEIGYVKETGLITVANAFGDALAMKIGSTQVEFNGSTYEQSEPVRLELDTAYFPLRLLAEAMHASVEWNPETRSATVTAVQPHTVADGDSLHIIAEHYETTAEALQLRNRLPDEAILIGQPLKVIVPSFLDKQDEQDTQLNEVPELDEFELDLLARLVQVEAGYEPYEGKLAVASVVMNRVNSDRFPGTLKDVIYAPNQFPPAKNGKLDKAKASEDSIKAARAALLGENNVPEAVYFFNAKIEPRKLKLVEVVKEIGNHTFGK